MNTQIAIMASYMNAHPTFMMLAIVWSAAWKLLALWKAAKRDHLTIFIILGVLNTAGLLEIIYIAYLYFKEKKNPNTK